MSPSLQRMVLLCSLAATLLPGGLRAQSIVTLNIDQSPSVVLQPTLTQSATIPNSGNALTVLGPAGANRYYVIGKTANAAVTIYDKTLQTPLATINFSAAPTAAALSADGSKLVVLAGNIHVIDTTTNADLTAAGGGISPAGTAIDLAMSIDATRAFVLAGDTGILTSIDLTSASLATATLQIPQGATSVSVSPDGIVEVTVPGGLQQIEPKTLRSLRTIDLSGYTLLKPVYNPASTKAIAAVTNVPASVSSAPAAAVVDLVNAKLDHTVASAPPDTFSQLIYAVNDIIYAYSAQTQRLYQFGINDQVANGAQFNGTGLQQIFGVAGSTEVTGAKTLYIVTNDGVYRADLLATNNILNGPTHIVGVPRGIVFIPRSNVGAIATGILQYNNGQKIVQGGSSLPFLLREYDINGNPVAGDSVTFQPPGNGVGVSPVQMYTNALGYAQAYLTANSQATAQDGVLYATYGLLGNTIAPFGFTVVPNTNGNGGNNGGTGGNPGGNTGAGLYIIAGNGEAVAQSFPSPVPLTVQARDVNGNPVPGVTVTFTRLQGNAQIAQTDTVITNSDGIAAVNVNGAGFLGIGSGSETSIFNATATVGQTPSTVQFKVVTIANAGSGLNGTVNPYLQKPPTAQTVFTGPTFSTLQDAIEVAVTSSQGQALTDVGIRLNQPNVDPKTQPYVSCDGPGGIASVDITGIAKCNLVFNGIPGSGTFQIIVGENRVIPATFNFTITGGAPAQIKIVSGNNQVGTPGKALGSPFVVQVTDTTGKAVPGTTVTFTVITANGGSLGTTTATTDANGQASTTFTLGANVTGPITVQAKSGNFSQNFTVTTPAAVQNLTKVSGDTQSSVIGTPFAQPLVVQVAGSNGVGLPNVVVTFAVTSGTATIASPTSTTDVNGKATTTITPTAAGAITVTASAAGQTATFNLTATTPGPQVTANNIVNAASFQAGVTPGALVTIIGKGIAPSVQGVVTPSLITGPLPTTLAGVSVSFNGIPAPIFAVSNVSGQEQVTVQVPFELPTGTASVTINGGGGSSTVNNVQVLPIQPGIFEYTDANGRRSAVLTRPDGSYVSPSNPARKGETITMYVTGLGQVSPATGTNRVGLANQNVLATGVVGINNGGVPIQTAVYQQGSIGLYQVTFVVPNDTASGLNAPLALAFAGPDGKLVFGNGSLISIQ